MIRSSLRGRRYAVLDLTSGAMACNLFPVLLSQLCCQHVVMYEKTSGLKSEWGTLVFDTGKLRAALAAASAAELPAQKPMWLGSQINEIL